MASSVAPESWAPAIVSSKVYSFEDFEEVSDINSSILMALLDEPQADERDHCEQLDDVIRSLEAEINPHDAMDRHSHVSAGGMLEYSASSNWPEDDQSVSSGHAGNRDWSELSDYSWIDVDSAPSTSCEGMEWYMEEYVDETMSCIVEFGCVSDYLPVYSLEESAYDSLWHDTYEGMMQN